MKYLNIKDIRVFNIEHTSKCNLLCPQCARVINGKINPNLHISSMSLSEYQRIINPILCKQIEHIFFCGNYGDAVADPKFIDCVKYLRYNKVPLTIYTNGSLRSTEWWTELSKLLDNNCKVIFAIDGIEDTSSLYRVNSNFNKVIENAKAFISNGGVARWDYLVFEYNYKEIEKAKTLASKIGFKIFNVKKTQRFIDNQNYKTNKGEGQFNSIIDKYGSWENYINQTEIVCKYQRDKILYIEFDLNLWPCCWVGAPLFFEGNENIQKNQLYNTISKYEKNFNSLKQHSIEEILNHPWFTKDLVSSWYTKMDKGKLMTCGRTCGKEYKFSSGDDSNKKEIKL